MTNTDPISVHRPPGFQDPKRQRLVIELYTTRIQRDTTSSAKEVALLTRDMDDLYARLGSVTADEWAVAAEHSA